MTREEINIFVNQIGKCAQIEYIKRGGATIKPSICTAQACLESGYGASSLMRKANAVFGIKATKTWKGKVYSAKTKECYDGVSMTTIIDLFRAYDSIADSVADYYKLMDVKRYAPAREKNTISEQINAIKDCGYATDPNYATKVLSILRTYVGTNYDTLYKHDSERKTDEQLATEVILGVWGNGQERKDKLTNAGYNYKNIQNIVNNVL